MRDSNWGEVYTKFGVRPVINAEGNQTVRGGSTPSSVVMQSMESANTSFVEMQELLEESGAYIASILGVDAAYVTSGCYAALVLSAAAVMTGNDPGKRDQLPDTTGLKNEILLQQKQRYGYDRSYTIPGSKLLFVGDEDGATPEQLENAIGPSTAAVAYLIRPDEGDSVVSLGETVAIAHKHNVLVIADGAAQIYPLDYFRRNAQSADLVCFGGKYFNAPHSTGFVCGKKDLVEAVAAHGFIGPRPFGRGMKVDRQEIIGLVTAIDTWFSMDHEKRSLQYDAKFAAIAQGLEGIPGVSTKVIRIKGHTLANLHLSLDSKILGRNGAQLADELHAGDPCIRVAVEGDDAITISAYTLNEGEELIIANRLRQLLT